MVITKELLSNMFILSAHMLKDATAYLSEIDAKFGDGDHGVTMAKIANLIEHKVQCWHDKNIKNFISNIGDGIMSIGGGSAGPLYGTLIGGFADALTGNETNINAKTLKKMFITSSNAMKEISTATIGDKTMMDAFLPAVDAAITSDDDILSILSNASRAANYGVKASENFIAKFGRAKMYKEETLGTPDAGAKSTSILLQGFSDAVAKIN